MMTQTLAKPNLLEEEELVFQRETPLLTGEDLFAMGETEWTELVAGKLLSLPPTGYEHGQIEAQVGVMLDQFVKQQQLGQVFIGATGIYTHRQPDTVRGADVAYVSNARLAQIKSQSYLDVAPELIVEILSPDDRWHDVMDKLEEYFAIGVRMVWVADPKRQQIFVYSAPTTVERLTRHDRLTGGAVLPGFQVAVAEIFAA